MIIIWTNEHNEASGVTNNTTDKRGVALCTPLPEVATPRIPKWSMITEWSFSDVPGNSVTWRVSRISHHMNIITPEPEGPEVSKQVTIQFGLVNRVTFLQQSSRPPGVRPVVCNLHHIRILSLSVMVEFRRAANSKTCQNHRHTHQRSL